MRQVDDARYVLKIHIGIATTKATFSTRVR